MELRALALALLLSSCASLVMMGPLPWGKKPCKDWARALRERGARPTADGFVCHPLAGLQWATIDEPARRSAARPSAATPRVDFDVVNSAAVAFAMDVDFAAALALARELDGDGDRRRRAPAAVAAFRNPRGLWQVADREGLALVVAHALLDRDVAVRAVERGAGVACDRTKLQSLARRRGWPAAPAAAAEPRDACVSEPSSSLLLDAAHVACSRDLEACVWPKVWHFATAMLAARDGDALAARFGDVPARWCASARRWTVGSRHRAMAARVSGLPIRARPIGASAELLADARGKRGGAALGCEPR